MPTVTTSPLPEEVIPLFELDAASDSDAAPTLALPAEIFTTSDLDRPPIFRNTRPCRITTASTFDIYPINSLDHLIAVISEKKPSILNIRYLVDTSGKLWFAEEGGACAKIPAHYQMTGESRSAATCRAAGNITFSSDYKSIVAINHKSGDFTPEFDSMKWLLAILIANEALLLPIKLADTLSVQRLSSSGGFEKAYSLKKEALTTWVNDTFDEAKKASFMSQPKEIKKETYAPPPRADRSSPPPSGWRAARLFFGVVPDAVTPDASRGAERLRPSSPLLSSHVFLPPTLSGVKRGRPLAAAASDASDDAILQTVRTIKY